MKCTSYLISKKLKEAGFEGKAEFYFAVKGNLEPVPYEVLHKTSFLDYDLNLLLPTYDLETILDALPKSLQGYELCIYFGVSFEQTKFTYNWQKLETKQAWGESLADTAGRLWLLLKEKGLV